MHISETVHYDAEPAQVLAMLADPAFHEQVAERSRPLRHTTSAITDADGRVTARIERTHSTEGLGLPAGIRLDEITLVQEQVWEPLAADGSARGQVSVDVAGMPVTFRGTLTLTPDGGGSAETLEGDLVAKIPLVGGRIEKAAAPAVLAAVRTESKVGASWLAQH